jgi:hypothetical protein
MDDPTRRCENDTDNGTRLLGAPPKREPHFFLADLSAPSVVVVFRRTSEINRALNATSRP